MESKECRMCGQAQNSANLMSISDELRNIIEYHCRITLMLSDSRYPNRICYDCESQLVSFSQFSEQAKENQFKYAAKFQQVKVEIEELPLIVDYNNGKPVFRAEPKQEFIEEDCDSNASTVIDKDDDDEEDEFKVGEGVEERAEGREDSPGKNEGSDFDDASSADSDSDYVGNKYYKRKRKPAKRQKRMRIKRARVSQAGIDDEISILNEVQEGDRYKNGTLKKKALAMYEGKTWKDMQISCIECSQVVDGPFELRTHYFKFHSLDSQFKCFECPESENVILSFFYQYLNHAIEHQESLKFCCVLCSEMFWNTRSLNAHYESSHDKSDRTAIFYCLRCGQYFRKAFDLTSHESRVHNVESVQDESETKASLITMESLFAEEFELESIEQKGALLLPDDEKLTDGSVTQACAERFNKQSWNNISVYQCCHCSAQLTTAYLLYEHYNAEHPGLKYSFLCKSCPDQKVFLNMESYINHAFTIHHEHLRYFCFICNAGYWNYKSMYAHYKLAHEDYKAFICLYCGKYHKCGYDIRHHKSVHMARMEKQDKSKVFSCSQCTKSFARQAQLQKHLDTHVKNDGKVWICETCGRSFTAKSTLINHASVHQTDKPFVCETCGEGFKNKYKLKHHKGIHTGEKNFACQICGQRFRAKGTLKGHMLTHTGERNFCCEFCDKRFAAKYDLAVHTRLHTGEYTHECPICNERYPSWSNYSKHMRGRHNVDPRSEKKKKYDALHKGEPSQSEMNMDSSSSSQYYQM